MNVLNSYNGDIRSVTAGNALTGGGTLGDVTINHQDTSISQETVDLLSPGYELSKIHKKGGAYIQTEASMLKEVVPESLIAFRSSQVKRIVAEIDNKIKALQKEGDMDGIMVLLEQKRSLDDFRKQLSRDLKRIIL